jgi:hypothetical protein
MYAHQNKTSLLIAKLESHFLHLNFRLELIRVTSFDFVEETHLSHAGRRQELFVRPHHDPDKQEYEIHKVRKCLRS